MESTVQLYLATRDVAERTGFRRQRYITKDGRYIVNDRDLRNIRRPDGQPATVPDDFDECALTPVSEQEAQRLIAENAYKTGNAADHGK